MARILRRAVIVLALAFGWLVTPNHADACSCRPTNGTACGEMTADAAIFTGTATGFLPTTDADGAPMRRYTFRVGERFHGLDRASATIDVTVDAHTSCALEFEIGGQYLVFARRGSSGLETGQCTRTARLADARGDLDALRDATSGGASGRLTGRVLNYPYPVTTPGLPVSFGGDTGVPGIDVVVSGPSGPRTVTSGADGWFTLTDLPRGRYRVEARPPVNRVARRGTDEAVVGQCGNDVWLAVAARSFEATIVGADGRPPAAGLPVWLVRDTPGTPASRSPRAMARTDSRGHVLVPGLPPGRYRVGVSVDGPPDAYSPYAQTWYGDPATGTVLDISDESTTVIVLRLPPRLSIPSVPPR